MAKGVKLIDTRSKELFAQGFIPGSLNIQGNNAFATWIGWLLNDQEPFILVTVEEEIEDLTRKLMRIGFDFMLGYLEDINTLGMALEKVDRIDIDGTQELLDQNNVQVVDLRGATEYQAGHIQGAESVFLGTLLQHLDEISRDKTVLLYCQEGDRATIGYTLLIRHGFKNVKNFAGGMNEWVKSRSLETAN